MRLFGKSLISCGLFLLAILSAGAAVAAAVANAAPAFAETSPQVNLTPFVELIEDVQGKLTLADVTGKVASRFKPVTATGDINLGYSKSTFWLRFPLAKGNNTHEHRLLEVAFFELGHLSFYAPDRPPVVTGEDYPVADRPWPHRFYVFPLTLTDESRYYYLQVRSDSAVTVPLTLWEPAAFAATTQKTYLGLALYYGALLALLTYNLLIFLSLRERVFLLYSLFAAAMGLGILAGNGIARQFLWPDGIAWNGSIPISLYALTTALSLYFSQHFLQTRVLLPKLHRVMHLAAGFVLLVAAMPWVGISVRTAGSGLSLSTILAGGLIVTAGILALRAGKRSARLFLLAWGVLSLGAIAAGMRSFGWLPTTTLTAYAVQLSSSAEMVLLSFALAERIRLERNAREAAQAETLFARQSLVESLRQSELRLEKTVANRTAEFQKSLKNEQKVLERYIRFGSLISHEFRNPLAIIKSQLVLIEKEREHGVDHAERRLSVISSAIKRLGVLFEEWLQSDRLRQQTLEINPSPIDLKTWLDGILEDCRACYSNHPFELRISPDLPVIPADESMLRIALLNLVDNAAKYAPAGTEISLEALTRGNMAGIAVIDRGPGIAPEHREDIFSAYFRSDPDGTAQGLGLGLTFVKKIVGMHHGEIELESEAGKGCRFCIWLPCNGKEHPHD